MKAVPSRTTWIWSKMKRLAFFLSLLLSAAWAFAQEPLSGIVVDDAGKELGVPRIMSVPGIDDTRKNELKAVVEQLSFRVNGKTYTEIENGMKALGYTSGRQRDKMLKEMLASELIYKGQNGRYYEVSKPVQIEEDDDKPF